MAIWNDYDRGYRGYGYGYGRPYYGWSGWGNWANDRDYGYRGYPGAYGWAGDYDRTYRVAPERSPTYGRQADQAVRRWARREGYDAGYTVQPRSGGYTAARYPAYGRDYGTARGGGYDWGYRW